MHKSHKLTSPLVNENEIHLFTTYLKMLNSSLAGKNPTNNEKITLKNSIIDARTLQPGEIVFKTTRYRSSDTIHRLGYLQSSVSVQINHK